MKNSLLIFSIVLSLSSNCLFAQKTWKGKGAGGTGTDFNTASNWNPSGVPTATDNVTITITSDATITLSANSNVKNLTLTVNGNNDNAILDVGSNTLTVNGTSTIDVTAGNSNTSVGIGVTDGSSGGVIDFKGNVSLGPSNNAYAYFYGNANSKLIFRGNLTLGIDAIISSNSSLIPGTTEFDGTGTQTITWNNTVNYTKFNKRCYRKHQ